MVREGTCQVMPSFSQPSVAALEAAKRKNLIAFRPVLPLDFGGRKKRRSGAFRLENGLQEGTSQIRGEV